MTLREVLNDVRSEVQERFKEELLNNDDYTEVLHEIADSAVPIYNADIMEIASTDNNIMHGVPECGPAFDGEATPLNIAASNIYDACVAAAHEEYQTLKEEHEEQEEERELADADHP